MKLGLHIHEGLSNLFSAKLRSFLAILGILVGTGSVVAMVSSGQLATEQALEQFKQLGTDLLSVSVYVEGSGPTSSSQQRLVTLADIQRIKRISPDIKSIAPYTTAYSAISYEGNPLEGSVIGITPELKDIIHINMEKGRFISFLDKQATFCVIGSKLATDLRQKGLLSPLGKQIFLGTNVFTIVGIAKPWPENSFFNNDINSSVLIPLSTALLYSKDSQINNIILRLTPEADIDGIQNNIKGQLLTINPSYTTFFRSAKQLIESMSKQKQTLTLMLACIGSISLLVGGIGVMNIMLVSVVERRREIGIRKAVGARRRDIQMLFLVESVMLALFGGLLGVLIGVTISFFIAYFAKWHFILFLLPPIIGFLVSAAIGIFSGFYPAYKAARLDPIECLRSD